MEKNMVYHVSTQGSDQNQGTEEQPFRTIQRAADIAVAGDRVVVHNGVYREWVRPKNGGISEDCRIVYQAAEGECPVIKGSEVVAQWTHVRDNVWMASVPNAWFGGYNPYDRKLSGDWFIDPHTYDVHQGEVYLNGISLFEAEDKEHVFAPQERLFSPHSTWGNRKEPVLEPEQSLLQWRAEVKAEQTEIYANFGGKDPNQETVEINVRRSCFYPDKTGINYITVRGFEMAHAATPWAPPTADQPGMLGPNWSKGWIIEDNHLHDAKCSAVSLGKEGSTGDNDFTRWRRKPGYQYQMEAVFRARGIGWSRERIGSHIVRNNRIHDCGQNGIVGHMGCAFSQIYGNEIWRIGTKHEFFGHEIGGIKLHAAIDVQIYENHIHHCSLGTWLDWQAQGVRVSRCLYDHNDRDFMIEVTHGPYLVDNNIFASAYNFDNAAQGGAYVNNLCCGLTNHYPVPDRSTPYHFPHSTQVLGTVPVYGSDDRWYQNIFVGGKEKERHYGTETYDGAPESMEEYIGRFYEAGGGDVETYARLKQPAYIDRNVYLNGAHAFDRERHFFADDQNPAVRLEYLEDGIWLEITLPEEMFALKTSIVETKHLGMPRITEARYENPDGTALRIDRDLTGKAYADIPVCGPIQELHAGKNRVQIWRKEKE